MLFLAVLVILETGLGKIEVEIDTQHAPVTSANFLDLVHRGAYDDGVFHRTVTPQNQPDNKIKIEVIQAGANPKLKLEDTRKPIQLERTNATGLSHVDGTISMARDGPDTAIADFFICIGGQPELDFGGRRNPDGQGFAAFGRVTKGMNVVRKIQQASANAQTLTLPVKILRAQSVP